MLDKIYELQKEIETVTIERDTAIKLLAEWCYAIERNGSGCDDWDEYYKDAAYRPNLIRNLLDAAIEKERNK